jgi:hypothetical protein
MKRHLFASSAALALVLGLAGVSATWAKPADLPAQNQIECPDGSDDPVQPPRQSIEGDLNTLSNRDAVKVGDTKPMAPMNLDAVCPAVISAYLEQLVKHLSEGIAAAQKQLEQEAAASRSLEIRLFDPINVRIEQVPLKQAIKNLASASGLPIAIDYKALGDAAIDLDAPVTLKVENLSAHKALRQFLDDLGLTYELKNGLVKITTPCPGVAPRTDAEKLAELNDRLAQKVFDAGEKFRRAGDHAKARTCYQRVHLLTPTTLHGRVAIARIIEIEERMRVDAEEQGNPGGTEPEEAFQRMRERTVPLGLVDMSF